MKSIFVLQLLLFFSCSLFAQVQSGTASFYADKFEGKPTASGEKYRHNKLTAAHRTLPFGTVVKVTNIANNQSVEVTINDRGPFVEGRVIDLSKAAAEKLGFINLGLAEVRIEVVNAGDGKSGSVTKPMGEIKVDEREFYDFTVKRKQPSGYGVQIGTYQELANLIRLSENLQSSYKKKVTVQVKLINGVKYYAVILGAEKSRKKAQDFRDEVKKKYPDAFIVDFEKL